MKKNIFTKICLSLVLVSSLLLINDVSLAWDSDFSSTNFKVSVSKFSPLSNSIIPGDTLYDKADNLLLTIIELLMVAIWVIALLVISIWAWYMIFYNWKEDFLTKWRNMIYTWFLALIIALSSFYIINLVRYILYT
jgi:hypothetical protein